MTCQTARVGNDFILLLGILNEDCLKPTFGAGQIQFDIDVNNGGAVSKGDTGITTLALPSGIGALAEGNWLGFDEPVGGLQKLVRNDALRNEGATDLVIGSGYADRPGAGVGFQDLSKAKWPVRMGARDTATVTDSLNNEDIFRAEDGRQGATALTTITTEVAVNGEFQMYDPGVRIFQEAVNFERNLHFWLYLPSRRPSTYEYDYLIEADCVPSGHTVEISTQAIVRINATLKLSGTRKHLEPKPVA